jgi:tetratricopeptide (TPR) repeat protein
MQADSYFQLHERTRPVTTVSPAAQRWFDRGLAWAYAYNQEEAVTCFRDALKHDPGCAMAWWGIAFAAGPFYNRPWIRYSPAEIAETLAVCVAASRRACELAERATPPERALIDAICARYPLEEAPSLERLHRAQNDFAAAMRTAHQAFPEDADIASLFAEAAITRTPRRLWNIRTGQPMAGSDTLEAMEVLERAMARVEEKGAPPHPGMLHVYIHLLEMSGFPEKALKAADRLRDMARDEGHFHHMPAHIYVQCGDYAQSVAVSQLAVDADDRYLARVGPHNFYTTARCHDLHLLIYAAMMAGQFKPALEAADRIVGTATPELLDRRRPFMASILDGYSAMRTHVLVRFGKWSELAREPAPPHPELTPMRVAMHAYGQGVANAALARLAAAEAAKNAFRTALESVGEDSIFLSNRTRDILAVAEAMLEGELEYRKGNCEPAFAALRLAVERDDNLNYTEPWAWMHPPRHALGALLAEQGRFSEAEIAYREDLGLLAGVARCCQHPDNIWALTGLLECVERDGRDDEAAQLRQRLAFARARADVKVGASCCCRGGA